MTPAEWERHKGQWCERCRFNSKRKPCPAIAFMDKDPNDVMCRAFIRPPRCTQYDQRPEPKRQKKPERKREKCQARRR